MNKTYYRQDYILKIMQYANKPIIKAIIGQRRIGKSVILRQCIDYVEQHFDNPNIIYIDKENVRFAKIKNADDLNEYVQQNIDESKSNYLFIDEIQEIEQFEIALRSLLNDENIDIYISGSNAQILSGELSTYLSGRYIAQEIHGLSYKEFLDIHNLADSEETMTLYLTVGGLPFLCYLDIYNESQIFEYLKNVYDSILLKDITQRCHFRNIDFIEKLAIYLADNIGSQHSSNNISKYLKSENINLNVTQIISYLKAFRNAFIIQQVKRTDLQGLKIFSSNDKYYFEDLGLRNCICGYNLTKDIGKLLENVVYNHLRLNGYNVKIGELQNKEIDFIGEKNNKKIYIQVTYLISDEKTYKREFDILKEIKDNYPKYVISRTPTITEENCDGIKHINVRSFLLNNYI